MIYLLSVFGYLIGSVSSAIVVSHILRLPDPRTSGSGNPGATNVLRLGGKKAAAITLAGDIVKGVIPVLIARALTDDARIIAAVMLAAFLGHLFPVFFKFRGGKGVATAFGALAAANGWLALALVATWAATAALTRYSSLSAITVAVLAPLYVWLLLPAAPYVAATVTMTLMLLWRHRSNIRNLLAGTEGKIGR